MKLLNLSHPLTPVHIVAIEKQVKPVDQVLSARCDFDPARSFTEQVRELIDQIGWSPEEWQTQALLVNPPSLSAIACVVLAELHGRMGYFPPVVRLRPVAGAVPLEFELAEIINLQSIRDGARARR